MSKPPIYPKGYHLDHTINVTVPDTQMRVFAAEPFPDWWPTMLGLLTIIGDAVRGVPWGKPAEPESNWCADLPLGDCIPVVTPKGAVRLAYKRWSMDKPYPSEHMVTVAGPDGEVYHRVVADGWPSLATLYRPATVIPTPTADGWRRVGDEQPDRGQVVFLLEPWSLPSDLPMLRRWISLHPDRPDDWLWQPVPPGVIPPPPADRDGGQ